MLFVIKYYRVEKKTHFGGAYMFGKRLKETRRSLGLTLEELATKYNMAFDGGLNKGTLSKYENGSRIPTTENLMILANFYNVSIDYILCRTQKREINK